MPKRLRKRTSAIVTLAVALIAIVAVGVLVPNQTKKSWAHDAVQSIIEVPRPDSTTIHSLQIPRFKLHLSNKDVAHLANLYRKYENGGEGNFNVEYYQKNNVWRKATLEIDGVPYRIKVRSHGSQPDDHRDGRYVSLAIKLRDDKQVYNANRFNLIIYPRIRGRHEKINWYSKTFGLPQQIDRLVALSINDWKPALYYMEHRLDNAHFEVSDHPSWKRFGDYNKSMLHGEYIPGTDREAEHESLYLRLAGLLEEEGVASLVQRGMLRKYDQLNEKILNGDVEGVEKFFVLDKIASYEAARLLAGFRGHGTTANNAMFFFDTSAGLFQPAMHRDFYTDFLKDRKTIFEHRWADDPKIFPLSRLLCRNEPISQAKYKKIWDIINNDELLAQCKHNYVTITLKHEQLKKAFWVNAAKEILRGPLDDAKIAAVAKDAWWVPVMDNARVLKERLTRCEPQVAAAVVDDQLLLAVTPNSLGALQFVGMQMNLDERMADPLQWRVVRVQADEWKPICNWTPPGKADAHLPHVTLQQTQQKAWFCDGLDEALFPADRTYYLAIRLPHGEARKFDPQSATIHLTNIVTGQGAPVSTFTTLENAAEIASKLDAMIYPGDIDPRTSFVQAQKDIRFAFTNDGSLRIPAGSYHVTKNVTLPRNVKLTIDPGVTLNMNPGVSFVAYGDLQAIGTQDRPITVQAADPEHPFGVFACLGDATTTCNVQHLKLSGGHEDEVDGAYFSGGFALHYHGQVNMFDCEIAYNHADDGANIKHANVHIERCTFKGNFADQVDLDLCDGIVKDCRFIGATEAGDSNGDGLDVSVARVVAANNQFIGFPDKGISVGEQSKLLAVSNTFESCRLGIAAKDESQVYLLANDIRNCEEVVFAYKKKKIWGGSDVFFTTSFTTAKADNCFADQNSSFWHVALPQAKQLATAPPTLDLLDHLIDYAQNHRTAMQVTAKQYIPDE